jgi:hypothetical protein
LFADNLKKGLIVEVAGERIGRERSCLNEIIKWHYQIGKAESEVLLEVVLQEKTMSLYSRLDDSQKRIVHTVTAFFAVLLIGTLCGIIYVFLNYPEPEGFWSPIGRHIRSYVGPLAFVFLALVVPVLSGVYKGELTISKIFWAQFLIFSGVVVWIYWHFISEPPGGMLPENPIGYLDYLIGRINTSVPLVISGMTVSSLCMALLKGIWTTSLTSMTKKRQELSQPS